MRLLRHSGLPLFDCPMLMKYGEYLDYARLIQKVDGVRKTPEKRAPDFGKDLLVSKG
jgi:hypothetical protein